MQHCDDAWQDVTDLILPHVLGRSTLAKQQTATSLEILVFTSS